MEHSEFEIQAEVYHSLKSQFPLVRGEYFYEPVDRRLDRFGLIRAHRFDIVVFNDAAEILAVVEVKKRKGKHRVAHYQKSVLAPVVVIEGMDEAPAALSKVKAAIADYKPTRAVVRSANKFMRDISAYVITG